MRERFIPRRFEAEAAAAIDQMNTIIAEYQAQGFSLTLRQLFYQFVARGLRPNTTKTYTYLGYVLRNARLAGLIDWDAIEDRTRETQRWSTWADPSELVRTAASGYAEDLWDGQTVRAFVWIEKAALVNIVEAACRDFQVPYFAVRGYNSSSEMYAAGKEFGRLISDRGIGSYRPLPRRPRPLRHRHAAGRGSRLEDVRPLRGRAIWHGTSRRPQFRSSAPAASSA